MKNFRFIFLLSALLLFFLLSPFLVNYPFSQYILAIIFSIILIFSVYTIGKNKWVIFVAWMLQVPLFILWWVTDFVKDQQWLLVLNYLFGILFFSYVTCFMLSYIMQKKRVTFNTIFGSICVYLLLGFTYGFIFNFVVVFYPQAFSLVDSEHLFVKDKLSFFVYYSFVTLTTLGYGDIIPLNGIAKTLSWLEAVMGQIYITVLVARLVGIHISQSILDE